MKKISTTIAGLLLSVSAIAAPVTVTTSANLVGQYDLVDTGEQTYIGANTFDYRNHLTTTTASILGNFQDGASGQWYQQTLFTQTYSYDYSAQDYSIFYQTASIYVNSVVGDQWIEMSMKNTTGSTLTYSTTLNATLGSKTSPRGNVQYITPAFGASLDGGPVTSFTPNWVSGGSNASFYETGSTDSEVSVVAEATDGGTLSFLQIYMYKDTAIGALRTEHYSQVSNQWSERVAISAPVPEPETYAMLLAGLGLMGAVARRRKNKANA